MSVYDVSLYLEFTNNFAIVKIELRNGGDIPKALHGLTTADVQIRRAEFGFNRLDTSNREAGPFVVFRRQLNNPLLLLLALASGISVYLAEYVDAGVIIGAIIVSVLLGFFQEYKAIRALAALKNLIAPQAWVIREGVREHIPADELVPDDLLLLAAGDKIAADGLILSAEGFEVSEAALTGESYGIGKAAQGTVAAGTVVIRGSAVVRVTAIGAATAMGKIAALVTNTESGATPLETRLAHLARQLSLILSGAAGLVLIIAIIQGRELSEALLATIALAVAVIPEGLPIMVTVMLAAGMERLARRQATVRRLAAVETLGAVTVAAVDKTGTITSGILRVAETFGDNPERILTAALLASDVGRITLATPDPLETAIAEHAAELGISSEHLAKEYTRKDAVPFDAKRRLMAVLVEGHGRRQIVVKGAPEVVLPACGLRASTEKKINLTIKRLTTAGLRVLAVAERTARTTKISGDLGTKLTFVGLISFIDPPREGATEAINDLIAAGVRPIMITGDHPATARRIASEIGLATRARDVATGAELRELSLTDRARRLRHTTVCARVLPEEKLLIVEALQHDGEIVAMTGDGINDGPALKAANIGVAMGQSGTEVAKETADLILLDDHLRTIVAAVEEGRTIVRNLQKGILYLLGTNIAELLIILGSMSFGWPLALTATQILWINLVADTFPVIGLAFESSPDVLKRGPISPRDGLLTNVLVRRALVMGGAMSIASLWLFWLVNPTLAAEGAPLIAAQAVTFAAIGVFQLGNVYTVRSQRAFELPWHNFRWPLVGSVVVGVGVLLFALTAGTSFLGTQALTATDWRLVLLTLLLVVFSIEAHKVIENWRVQGRA